MENFTGPSIPSNDILITAASLEAWFHAKKQAARSPMVRFKAGCVIWDPSKDQIVSKGCSHPDIKFSKILGSVHAERHALSGTGFKTLSGFWAIIFTFGSRGGCSWSSRPCYSCANALYQADVERVIYPERLKNGNWTVVSEYTDALIARAPLPTGVFARHQRIPRAYKASVG